MSIEERIVDAVKKTVRNVLPRSDLKELTRELEELRKQQALSKRWLTCEETSRYVGGYWSRDTVQKYVREGKIPGAKMGDLTMVDREALEAIWAGQSEME